MALFDTTSPMGAGHRRAARLTAALGSLAASFTAWNDARVTRKALSRLSAHELDDLGLTRADIETMSGRLRR